jgi:hypothetical protein
VAHTLRSKAYARPIVKLQPPAWLLLLRYFQPFATPDSGTPRTGLRPWGEDSLDPIFTYSPAGSLQQRRDPPIPIVAILAGQYDDGLGEYLRLPTVSVDNVACPLAGLPVGTHGAQGLEVSLRDVLQHQLVQAQLSHQPLQLRVLLLQLLQTPSLIHLQPAELLAPAVVGLLRDQRLLLACAVVFPFATATSICRSKLTICSGLCLFPRAIQGSSHTSLSHRLWYKSSQAFH